MKSDNTPLESLIALAIHLSLKELLDPAYQKWGLAWLEGKDRTAEAAEAAGAAIYHYLDKGFYPSSEYLAIYTAFRLGVDFSGTTPALTSLDAEQPVDPCHI